MSEIKKQIARLGGAKKSLGQHFLNDEGVVQRMVKVGNINKDDTVLEIGPGLGILTRELTKSPAKKIIACEKDDLIYEFLQNEVKQKNLSIVHKDALLLIPNIVATPPFKVISNLPYNIASPVIISLLTVCPVLPEKMVLMVQKEVAQRLTTKPGGSNRGILTVFLELFADVKIIEKLSPGQFYPPPQVESAVVLIDNIKMPDFDRKRAFKIIKTAFSKKRKKIKNSLFASLEIYGKSMNEICSKVNITPDLRAEDLDIEQWRALIGALPR